MLIGYYIDLPQVEELALVRPNVISYVYSNDGHVLGEYALEKRVLVTYDQIPDAIKHAILSAEDSDFFEHSGIDFDRFFVAAVRNVLFGQLKGASTITMQLCKLRFTSTEKTIERKIKDMLFALSTEKKYSKEQIFTLYFNQMYMGHGIYGVAAAADFYFGKTLDELTLAESALLAGILPGPSYSPIRFPKRALSRRSYVLSQMFKEGYISRQALEETQREPLHVPGKDQARKAAYFVEWVRQDLEKNYSTERIWQGGLRIHTTLNYAMQLAAHDALRNGLRTFDKQTPWEGAEENILDQGLDMDEYRHPDWKLMFQEGELIHGLVTETSPESASVKLGSYEALLSPTDVEWTGKKKLDKALRPGDIAVFELRKVDRIEKVIEATLDRIPEVQGAFMVLDNSTGAILAMVGGFDFRYSKFNRATQAPRQPGSLFKPFTYAVAMEEGRSPYDMLLDAPFYHVDAVGRPYEPKNSDDEFKGLIPLQQAIAESRNVPTIRLAQALGIEKVIEMAHRFGIKREFVPVLPISLGAGELTLQEITSAFTVFANRGVRAKPFFVRRVEDYHGQTLEDHQTEFEQVLSPEVNSKMLYLLRQVVQVGTAWRVKSLGRPIAGKTGTTNESTDTWFVGLTPRITAGVWVGHDQPQTLGEKMYGANVALPIWLEFMEMTHSETLVEDFHEVYEPSYEEISQSIAEREAHLAGLIPISVEDIPPPGTYVEEEEGEDPPKKPTTRPPS
jgi:penicillin-binding protein 1A